MEVTIPYEYTPRKYQMATWEAFEQGVKRFCDVWHRRAGKDKTWFNIVVSDAVQHIGTYYYFFPTYSQGKKILWDGIDPRTGVKFLDHVPEGVLKKKHEAEMKLTLTNGSIIQLIGTDNYDSIVGTNPRGCVFSEYSLQDPMAWKYIQPILAENKGWAAFVFTPRGRNHAWELYEMARGNPLWHTETLTVRDTARIDGTPVISLEEIEKQRGEGMGDELIEQEYFCSFEGFVQGAYYVKQLREARNSGRISSVPYAGGHEVYTFWDLGIDDSTTIWFLQVIGKEFRFIDYYENSGEGLEHYAKVLKEKRYVYGDHYMPHDANQSNVQTGKKTKDVAEDLGIYPVTIVKRARDSAAVMAGIEQGRNILSQCWFDEKKCARGLMALEGYQCEYDEEKKKMGNHPVHNWCFVSETYLLTKHGRCAIKDLPSKGEVLTLCGWKPYHNPRMTRRNAQLVEVVFADGYTVKCTPEHLFLTEKGWKSAENLTKGIKIQSSLMNLRNILMVAYIEYRHMKDIIKEAVDIYTGQHGELPLVKFLRDVTYTIRTAIYQTMFYPIWNVCQATNICQTNGGNLNPEEVTISRQKQDNEPMNGISRKQGGCGTVEWRQGHRVGQNGKENLKIALFAIKNIWHLFVKAVMPKFIARHIVNPLVVTSVKPISKKEDVWCITVPDGEHFSLSNGAVVHNCSHGADAFRTFAVGYSGRASKPKTVTSMMDAREYVSAWG